MFQQRSVLGGRLGPRELCMHSQLCFADTSLHAAKYLAKAEERTRKGCLRDAKLGYSSGPAGVDSGGQTCSAVLCEECRFCATCILLVLAPLASSVAVSMSRYFPAGKEIREPQRSGATFGPGGPIIGVIG